MVPIRSWSRKWLDGMPIRRPAPGRPDNHVGEDSSFCISLPNGDIQPELPHGVFFQDTRILSCWSLTVNGQLLEPLAAETKEPYRALFAGRGARSDGHADIPLLVERLREVAVGITEEIRYGTTRWILSNAWSPSASKRILPICSRSRRRASSGTGTNPAAGRGFADDQGHLAGCPFKRIVINAAGADMSVRTP